MILLNHKWGHAILSFKIFKQLSTTSKNPEPFAWPMKPNMICPLSSTPTLLLTPPSFINFALAILPSFLFLKYTNAILLRGLGTCYFLNNSHGSLFDFTQVCSSVSSSLRPNLTILWKIANINPQVHTIPSTSTWAVTLFLTTISYKEYFYFLIIHHSYWNVIPQRQGLSVLFTVVTPMPRIGSSASVSVE